MFKAVSVLALLALASSCTSTGAPARAASFDADGVYITHLRVRLAPSHTKAFEALMKRCVESARAAGLASDYDWLCYREPPGRYWLVHFSETADGFALPESLEGFVDQLGRAEGEPTRDELMTALAELEYETEWAIVARQKASWSTVASMSTATHPKARMMDRTVRPGMEAEFDAALEARTAFFAEHAYPLPVEGFVILDGAPGRAMQIVFPVDWSSFHDSDSFFAFVKGLDEAARDDYAARKAALMVTMAGAEYFDGSFVPELCYSAE